MSSPFGNIFNNDDSSLDSTDSQGQTGDIGQQAQGNNGFNPAFTPLLNDIPQDLHSKVLPHLQEWDKGVAAKLNKVQQGYEPWKPIIDMGVTPENVQIGLNLINLLEQQPETLYRALVDYYHFGDQQQQGAPGQGQNTGNQQQQQQQEEDPYAQKYNQLEQGFNTLANHVLSQNKQQEQARADQALDTEIQAARKQYGDVFDEEWIIAKCMANDKLTIADAAKMYSEWYQKQAAKFGARPLIMGAGGNGLPQQNVDVTKLSPKDTRSLVAQMIEHANMQNRG